MIDPKTYLANLQKNDINFFSGVPDSLLKQFCACIQNECKPENHIIAANEGGAIGLAIGYHLGSGKVPMVYLQNSGVGNTINPILSLASNEVYGIPMIIMVGWRGEPGIKDEPQHIHQGRVMIESLQAMDIDFKILSTEENEAINQTKDAIELAKDTKSPIFLIVKKDSFSSAEPFKKNVNLKLSREEAIVAATKAINDDSLVVCTTGMPSKELFEFRALNKQGHFKDFLTVGGMGHASQIAMGLSLTQQKRKIYCFDGDGAAIMHMGSLAIIGQSSRENLTHIIFNNGVHDSVGGQPTVGFEIDFCGIAKACGYRSAKVSASIEEISSAIRSTERQKGPHLIEIHVRPGNKKGIGRPTKSPSENKIAFMKNTQQ